MNVSGARSRPGRLMAALLALLTLGLPAWACLNHYSRRNVHGELLAPQSEPKDYFLRRLTDHSQHLDLVKGPAPVEPSADADFKVRNDYAVTLVRRKECRKAVEILESIEREHPGEYTIAANLGTAYELSGDLDKARHWIAEGMRRNPKSHQGTEWLHLRILEARQAAAKDPAWVNSHSVLGLDFGTDPIPRKPSSWPKEAKDVEDVIQALTYQLGERLAFVPPPDAIVGGMIADLADLLALYRTVDHAIHVYNLALAYKPAHADLIASRHQASRKVQHDSSPAVRFRSLPDYLLVVALLAFATACGLGIRNLLRRPGGSSSGP